MTRAWLWGVSLRLLGPVVEIIGLVLILDPRTEQRRFVGIPGRVLAFTLLGIGLIMVIAGLVISTMARRSTVRAKRARDDLDLRL